MKFFLLVISASLAISIACSATKSASSQVTPQAPTPHSAVNNAQSPAPTDPAGQEKPPCPLKMTQVPIIKGLKLGMTSDEILAVFPGSKDDAELRAELARPPRALGNSSFVIRPEKYGIKDQTISQITVSLLDGRASKLDLGYKGPQWKDVDEFISKFIEGTNLPVADEWQPYAGLDTQMKTLTCADFSIRLFAGGEAGNLNSVLLTDLEADKKLKDRRKKAAAEQSPTPNE